MNLVRLQTEAEIQSALEGVDKNFEPRDGRIAGDFRKALQDFRGEWVLDLGSDVYTGRRWFDIEGENIFGEGEP